MKSKSIALSLFALTFTIFLFTSCGDKKNDAQPAATQQEESETHDHESETEEKEAASANYQCPMDCEDGKTYEGSRQLPRLQNGLESTKLRRSCNVL